MAVYHIESITIRDKSVIPLRVQCEATIDYQTTHEVTGDQEVVQYKGDVLGVDQSTYFTRMRMDDGTTVDLRNSDIISVFQEYDVETGSTIYWGASLVPPPNLGKLTDVYISKNGDCYSLTETGWKLQTNIRGPVGATGASPKIGVNGNWFIDGKDSGIPARGDNGKDGASPIIDSTTKHWFLKGVDLGVCAEGQTPYIGTNGNWWIGTTDTGVTASGSSLLPAIDPTTKHWIVDGKDTGIIAEGHDGKTPYIDPTTKHWFINGTDTGVVAEGVGGAINISINTTTQNWEIDGVDTGIPATGPQGPAGAPGQDGKSFQLFAVYENTTDMDTDEPNVPENSFVALITKTDILLYIKSHGYTPDASAAPDSRPNFIWVKNLTDMISIAGVPGKDGVTPHIDPVTKHWMVGTKDTGVNAEPPIPYIGANNNWWIGTTDTGVSALGASGITPTIDPTTKHWMLGTVDTGVLAEATLPTINPTTKNWMINGVDTGIHAVGQDGLTPYIGGNGHWFVGATDTGVSASGAFPVIDATTNHWFIDGVDTGVSAVGPAGKASTIAIDPTTKNWMIDGLDTGVSSVGANGITPTIGTNGNWWIGTTDTGVNAQGVSGTTPHIDPMTKHWMIGTTDTGIVAEGQVDEKDLQLLKNRLNSLIGSKHTCRQYDWLFAAGNVRTTETTVSTGINWLSLLPDVRGTMELSSDWYVTLKPNRTYKLYASSSAATLGHAFRWTDRNGKIYFPYGLTSRNTTCTPSVTIVEVGDDPIDITCLWDTAAAGRVAIGYTSLVIEEFGYQYDIDPVEYIMHEDGIEDTPVGTIIPYMGTGIPKHYLPCDGTILNIDDYPDLSAHFVEQFGKAEHFGGDGVTTFAVPDLRGEFLRGTGANSHKEQGNGAAVGTHQDGTVHPSFKVWASHRLGLSNKNSSTGIATFSNQDSSTWGSNVFERRFSNYNTSRNAANTDIGYTSRPTNTSVQWLIKCERTPFLQIGGGSAITDVSKEPGNLIEEKSDGIFVDVPISADSDNIFEKKADGFYVPDVPDELRRKVNLLTEAKHTTKDADYAFLYFVNAQSAKPALSIVPFNGAKTNMEYDTTTGILTLRKDHMYRLDADISGNVAASMEWFDTDKNEAVGFIGHNSTAPQYMTNAIAFLQPKEDMHVALRVCKGSVSVTPQTNMTATVEEVAYIREVDPVNYLMGTDGIEASPVGNIISYMGTTPPEHYLACDGTEYQIADYAQLASHFIDQFGSANHFGGDGVDTFCVPDVRGEFLRGTGANSHADQGSGSDVGNHQNATLIPNISGSGGAIKHLQIKPSLPTASLYTTEYDSGKVFSKNYMNLTGGTTGTHNASHPDLVTTRPTNTSVLYCIKYESTPFVQIASKVVGVEADEEVFREVFTNNQTGEFPMKKSVTDFDELWIGVFSAASRFGLLTQKTIPVEYLPRIVTLHYNNAPSETTVGGGRNISFMVDVDKVTIDSVILYSAPDIEVVIRAKKYADASGTGGGTTDISKEPGNLIETKPDGLFADVPVSAEPDNILEKKDDGMYVPDVPEEIRLKVNLLSRAKHTTEEVQFFFATEIEANDVQRPTMTNGTSFLKYLTARQGNLPVSDDGDCVILDKNKTYRIQCYALVRGGGSFRIFNADTNTKIGSMGYYNGSWGASAATAIITTTDTTRIDFRACDATSGVLSKRTSYVMVEEINKPKEIDPVEYVMGTDGIEASPVGSIISYMGATPPKHYIACDGTEYPIADYAQLAQHFIDQFGKVDYFGGDGVDTFAVPDLRNEFIRGYHGESADKLSGEIGVHQEATVIPDLYLDRAARALCFSNTGGNSRAFNPDTENNPSGNKVDTSTGTGSSGTWSGACAETITVRPTNTAVLFCIKYESTPFVQINSKVVGVEVDEEVFRQSFTDGANGTYPYTKSVKGYDELWVGVFSSTTTKYLLTQKSVPVSYLPKGLAMHYNGIAGGTAITGGRSVSVNLADESITVDGVTLNGNTGVEIVVRAKKYTPVTPGAGGVSGISKEDGNIIVEKSDGIYAAGPDISKETDNILEKKNDGLFVAPTSISAEEGNEIIKKSDGLFVDSHVELKKRINRLYTGKYGNLGEPGFFQVHRQVDPTEIESVSITAGQNILSKYSKYDTNMEVDNNGCVKLLGGHRYRLAANIFISRVNASCVFMTNDGTPIGSFCYATRTTDGDPLPSGESLVALYEPDVDVYVALKMTATYPANTTGALRKLYTSVVIEEIEQFREIDPVEYLMDNEKIEDSPIGEIISYMGTTPPAHYIACDGAIRPIVEFPQLAEHFRVAFGSVNHFGGDGIDTFAVPNLNGEFLRGSGANGHANQGSGGPVGSHQNATIQTAMLSYSNKLHVCNANNASSGINTVEADVANCDFAVSTRKYASAVTLSAAEKDDGYASSYTSRPTNTSVLYCIKYERTPFAQIRANALAVTKNEQLLDTALADNGTYSLNHPISNYDEIWFGIMSNDADRVLMREKRVPAELATRKIILDYVSVSSATSVGTCRQVWLTVSDTTIATTIKLYGASGIRLVVRGIRYVNLPDGPVSVPLSKDADNAIEAKDDGLFVQKEVVYTDEEINEAVMEIFFPEKLMLERAKASTPKTLEELDDIFAEAPNNALGSYMIAPVEGEIPKIE